MSEWRCMACGRRGDDASERCACGAHNWTNDAASPVRVRSRRIVRRRPVAAPRAVGTPAWVAPADASWESPPVAGRAPAFEPPVMPPHAQMFEPHAVPARSPPPTHQGQNGSPVRLVRVSEMGGGMVIDRYGAELSEALGGVRRGGTIVLAGVGGAGKSTLAAELAVAVAEELRGHAYWLDRDQQAHDLLVALFERTNSPTDRVVSVEPRDPQEPEYVPMTWELAFSHVPRDAAVLVVDSLETWADSYAEQVEVARQTMAHAARLKILIAGVNAKGNVEGFLSVQRACDAVVIVHPTHFHVQKCRWMADYPKDVPRRVREPAEGADSDMQDGADEAPSRLRFAVE